MPETTIIEGTYSLNLRGWAVGILHPEAAAVTKSERCGEVNSPSARRSPNTRSLTGCRLEANPLADYPFGAGQLAARAPNGGPYPCCELALPGVGFWVAGEGCNARVSHPGLWANLRVFCAAFSAAITKHTRSGPRPGNGAFVYLKEIGSMYWQSWSGRICTTRPWIAAIR